MSVNMAIFLNTFELYEQLFELRNMAYWSTAAELSEHMT